MAHPYFLKEVVFADIEKLDSETDSNFVDQKGEQADDEIDNKMPSPTITVPFDTVPDIIKIASTKRCKGIIYKAWGLEERGQKLIDDSDKDCDEYVKTFKLNAGDRTAVVTILDNEVNNFTNSPIVDDYFFP